MKFLWLRDALVTVLFENEEIIAVDKPYGFDTHTNESKVGQADFVQPGLIELFEKQLARSLHIVHRLDRTTTGVIVFAKTLEAAQIYQGYFRARETRKIYLFVTASSSRTSELSSSQPIVRNGAELEATTDFTRLKQANGFELWQARPRTGRNHQIRIHAAALGLPLLGDAKYGGAPFPFICLHNHRIEFPNGVAIESRPPRFFTDLSLLENQTLSRSLLEIEKRERLFQIASQSPDTLSFRLIHTPKDSPDRGLSLDRLGPRDVLSWHQDAWDPEPFEKLSAILQRPMLVRFMKGDRESVTLNGTVGGTFCGEPTERWVAQDHRIKYEVRARGLGLYLDQRLQRNWVLENARDQTVLNLFASTCGYSVAAALGGAKEVVSVDSNKSMLNWGRENFALNGLDPSTQTFLCRDAVQYLEQTAGKKTFDLVICDPPSFSRGEKGLFKIEQEFEKILDLTMRVGRRVLFSTSSDALFVDDLRRAILKISKTAQITSLQPGLDFEAPGDRIGLKSLLIEL